MATENFQIKDADTGKTYWISRSCAVVACIVTKNPFNKEILGLFERRGPGCPDYVGCWAFPCGYLGWDETRKEAVIREVREELGIDVSGYKIKEWKFIDDPKKDGRQNICTRYIIKVPYKEFIKFALDANFDSKGRGGEEGEVDGVKVISLRSIEEDKKLEFAFNHDTIFKEVVEEVEESKLSKIWKAIVSIIKD